MTHREKDYITMRVTQAALDQCINTINKMGIEDISLGHAYGGIRVENAKGSRDLSPRGTKKETYNWLMGFMCALEMANNALPKA